VIRDLGDSVGSAVFGTLGRVMSRTQERRPLPVDLLESDNAYLAIFDAPGVHSSDVQVRFEDNNIYVQIDRFREFHEGFKMVFPGRGLALDGRAELPEDASVDPEDATATLNDDGTLHVRLPKADGETSAGGEDVDVTDDDVTDDDVTDDDVTDDDVTDDDE
jgi:HSP20 family protein